MKATMEMMVDNLTSDRADRFDQGCREAADLIQMLQGSLSFPTSGGSSHLVTENLLDSVGKILEESLKYPNDVARHHALRSVAAAMAQALVPSPQNRGHGNDVGGNNAGASQKITRPTELKQRRKELEKSMYTRNDILDWHAAALDSQTALLTSSVTSTTAAGAVGTNAANLEINTLDALLAASLHVSSLCSISGAPSMLLKTAQQVPFLSSSLPTTATDNKHSHSQVGWIAYLTLQPQALHQLLIDVLSDAANSSSIQASIDSDTQWKAGIAAIAASPALHIATRSILRAWLATSGNIHIWLLHWHLFKLSCGGDNSKSTISDSRVLFPENLYPGNLRNTAECVFEACISLDSISLREESGAEKNILITLAALSTTLETIRKQPMSEDVFSLLLDGLDITRAALRKLLGEEERNRNDIEKEQHNKSFSTLELPVDQEVAEWLAIVMWPFNTTQQRLLCDALTQQSSTAAIDMELSQEVRQSIFILKNTWCRVLLD